MNENQHTVTIPISDYNELMAVKEFSGLILLTPEMPLYKDLRQFLEYKNNQEYRPSLKNPMDTVVFYFKTI